MMFTFCRIFVLSLLTLAMTTTAFADTCHDFGEGVTFLGNLAVDDVACSARNGDTMILGLSTGDISVVDFSDPAHPFLRETIALGATPMKMKVLNNLVYVTAGIAGVFIVDAPADGPLLVLGSYDTPGYAFEVEVRGTTAYVADSTGGLAVLNVADAAAIELIATVPANERFYGVELVGDFVAVHGSRTDYSVPDGSISFLQMLDLSDPETPVVADELLGGSFSELHAVGSQLYCRTVSTIRTGPDIWDTVYNSISVCRYNADATGQLELLNTTTHPYLSGRFVKCTIGGGEGILSLALGAEVALLNPTTLDEFASVPLGTWALASGQPILADGLLTQVLNNEVQIFSIEPMLIDSVIQTTDPNFTSRDYLSIVADHDLVVDGAGYATMDEHMVEPDFRLEARTTDGGLLNEVAWSRVWYGGGGYDSWVSDVTPSAVLAYIHPTLMVLDRNTGADMSNFTAIRAHAVAGDLLYSVTNRDGSNQLEIHNLTDLAIPQLLGSLPAPDNCTGMVINGNLLHIMTNTPQVTVVDVSDPEFPEVVGEATYPFVPIKLLFRDALAFVIQDNAAQRELATMDLTDALLPAPLGSVAVAYDSRQIAIRDNHAYLTSNSLGIIMVDITSPADPIVDGNHITGRSCAVAVTDAMIVLSSPRRLSVLAPACGGVTPAFVISFDIANLDGRVNLSWQINDDISVGNLRLKASHQGHSWMVPLNLNEGIFSAVDNVEASGTITYTLEMRAADSWIALTSESVDVTVPVVSLTLQKPWPNPFNPLVNIAYSMSRSGQVELTVYDLKGQVVTTLVQGYRESGPHSVKWAGTNEAGGTVSAGSYFVRLKAEDGVRVEKITLLK